MGRRGNRLRFESTMNLTISSPDKKINSRSVFLAKTSSIFCFYPTLVRHWSGWWFGRNFMPDALPATAHLISSGLGPVLDIAEADHRDSLMWNRRDQYHTMHPKPTSLAVKVIECLSQSGSPQRPHSDLAEATLDALLGCFGKYLVQFHTIYERYAVTSCRCRMSRYKCSKNAQSLYRRLTLLKLGRFINSGSGMTTRVRIPDGISIKLCWSRFKGRRISRTLSTAADGLPSEWSLHLAMAANLGVSIQTLLIHPEGVKMVSIATMSDAVVMVCHCRSHEFAWLQFCVFGLRPTEDRASCISTT